MFCAYAGGSGGYKYDAVQPASLAMMLVRPSKDVRSCKHLPAGECCMPSLCLDLQVLTFSSCWCKTNRLCLYSDTWHCQQQRNVNARRYHTLYLIDLRLAGINIQLHIPSGFQRFLPCQIGCVMFIIHVLSAESSSPSKGAPDLSLHGKSTASSAVDCGSFAAGETAAAPADAVDYVHVSAADMLPDSIVAMNWQVCLLIHAFVHSVCYDMPDCSKWVCRAANLLHSRETASLQANPSPIGVAGRALLQPIKHGELDT